VEIYDMMANRIKDPVGFMLSPLRLSYKVRGTSAKRQTAARIRVFEEGEKEVFDSGVSEAIDSLCFVPDIALKPRTAYTWTVDVTADDGGTASGAARFETAKMDEPFRAVWISPADGALPNAEMCRRFDEPKRVRRARAYISGLGLYELYINGEKVSPEVLTPYCNAYDRWIQYQTFDVTALVRAGDNDIRVMLGDGWYKGRFGFSENHGNIYGDAQALIMELIVTYEDGTERVIATDETWRCNRSKVKFADMYDGEDYDATFVAEGDFPVKKAPLTTERLRERLSLPVTVMQRIAPKEIIITPKGETVIDLGQEITGYLEFTPREKSGTRIKLSYGEILQQDCFYNANLRSAKAEFYYTCDGEETAVRPHFTFYGFRYVKLEGFTHPLNIDDFTGCVLYSQIPERGKVRTNHEKFNRFALNALWGQKGNYLDVPTDCPQRDERMGWTGDAQAFAGTACFQMEVAAFMQKYIYDMYEEQQKSDGMVPHVVPRLSLPDGGSCAWADAAAIIPWTLYLFYGDKALLAGQYPAMRAWLEWVVRTDEASGGTRLWRVGFHYADWLALDTENGTPFGGTDPYFVASAFYYYTTSLVLKAAKALGYEDDARKYALLLSEIGAAIEQEYFTPNGRLAESTQTAHVCALHMGFTPGAFVQKTRDALRRKFEASDHKLRSGFVGTSYLNRVLSNNGMNDLAYELMLNEEYPGWLYEVNLGATTVWERWNSILPDGTISDTSMNSMNHYAYGAVMEWFYRDVAGLNPDPDNPGFRHARLAPKPNARLSLAEAEYESAVGKYVSAWRLDEGAFHWTVEVPFNACATAVLPGAALADIQARYPALGAREQGGEVVCELSAGRYAFDYTIAI
jgi:alpha-L-rhamnosidase